MSHPPLTSNFSYNDQESWRSLLQTSEGNELLQTPSLKITSEAKWERENGTSVVWLSIDSCLFPLEQFLHIFLGGCSSSSRLWVTIGI